MFFKKKKEPQGCVILGTEYVVREIVISQLEQIVTLFAELDISASLNKKQMIKKITESGCLSQLAAIVLIPAELEDKVAYLRSRDVNEFAEVVKHEMTATQLLEAALDFFDQTLTSSSLKRLIKTLDIANEMTGTNSISSVLSLFWLTATSQKESLSITQ